MKKLFSKTFMRFIAQSHSHGSSTTTSNLSASSLLHPSPQTSTSLMIQTVSPVTPPTKKKGGVGSWFLWFSVGLITYGIGVAFKTVQTEMCMYHRESRRKCLKMEPTKLNTIMDVDVDSLGFKRVVCKGVFDEKRSIYVGPKPRSGAEGSDDGFYVITPLLPIPNEPNSVKSPILVNRGWVPLDWEEKSLEPIESDVAAKESKKANDKLLSSQKNPLSKLWYTFINTNLAQEQVSREMHVEVVGIVRKSETPDLSVVAYYPNSLAWFYLDVPKLAQAMGFGEDTIYLEKTPHQDIDESRPYPAPRDVEDLIHSKPVSMNIRFLTTLWHMSSMACFAKASSAMLRRYAGDLGSQKEVLIPCFILFISYKYYKFRHLFCVVDTIGVGCVTKLDPVPKKEEDQVKVSIIEANIF